jgi:RES domain-containing protein
VASRKLGKWGLRLTDHKLPMLNIEARFWRMLDVKWQKEPLSGAGAARAGGRWNRPGEPALYLGQDHSAAIAEFHQDVLRPGTLAAYDVRSNAIVDLTDPATRQTLEIEASDLDCLWKTLWGVLGQVPPTWEIAKRLCADGAHGALVPSIQQRGATNLVLWKWSEDGQEGATINLIDPDRALSG